MIECIGVVSPGTMGSAVGRSLSTAGSHVVVALDGRSEQTSLRASRAGLEDVGTLAALVEASEVVLSIVPPKSAVEVATSLAEAIAATRMHPLVIDANAISPTRARTVARLIEQGGGQYVDGGIVGGPPAPSGRTDLFLSGADAQEMSVELTTPELVAICIGNDPSAASTLKMCHAAWTKGTSALLITIRSVARRQGVEETLAALWARSQPELLARSENEGAVASRAWRWVEEMAEVARTFEDSGLPGGAAQAASQLYERLARFKDADSAPSLDQVVTAVLS